MGTSSDFTKVYDVKEDKGLIWMLQDYQSDGIRRGLHEPAEHGLVGSPEWWTAIDRGALPVKSRLFVITSTEWVESQKMGGDMSIEYTVTEAGESRAWMPPAACPELSPGDLVRVESSAIGSTSGTVVMAVWKASPAKSD